MGPRLGKKLTEPLRPPTVKADGSEEPKSGYPCSATLIEPSLPVPRRRRKRRKSPPLKIEKGATFTIGHSEYRVIRPIMVPNPTGCGNNINKVIDGKKMW